MASRKSEPAAATASLIPVVQLASKSHKTRLNTGIQKSSLSSGFYDGNDDGTVSSSRPVAVATVLQSGSEPVRKSSSVQCFGKTDSPMKRTQSAQNICHVESLSVDPDSPGVGRLESASNKGRQRLSSRVSAIAYNAGLLASFEKEKKQLERRISELIQIGELRRTENEKLKFELRDIREHVRHQNVFEELELLREENRLMRGQLLAANMSLEHFTDCEKLLMLQDQNNQLQESLNLKTGGWESGAKLHSSSDADSNSKDLESVGDPSFVNAELRSCLSLDANWDRQSNKSSEGGQSEVASLQDRILQMEETHCSTNEELQATLQELTDLQDTVDELSAENEGLADEKLVLLESLFSQTEKLENARLQIEQLKVLLVCGSKSEERSQFETQLVALLRCAEEEKEELLLKETELSNAIQTLENENHELQDVVAAMKDKSRVDDAKLESLISERRAIESQLCGLKEQAVSDVLDIQDLKTLLENESVKGVALEQDVNVTSESDHKNPGLEGKLRSGDEGPATRQNESARLKEMLELKETELKFVRDSAEMSAVDFESQVRAIESEKVEIQSELDAIREHNDRLRASCDQFAEERKTYTMTVARAESELRIARSKISRLETELAEKTEQFAEERETWKQFQSDLQKAVVIANDLKTETQESVAKLLSDKEALQEQNVSLRQELEASTGEIERLKQELQQHTVEATAPILGNLDLRGKVLSSVDRELTARRQGRLLGDSKGLVPNLSVKHLISTIEEQVKNESPSPSASNPVLLRCESNDGVKPPSDAGQSDLPSRVAVQRQLSSPSGESSRKSGVRRTNNESKEVLQPPIHRHTVVNIIKESSTVTDDDKQAVAASAKAPTTSYAGDGSSDAGRKPRAGILMSRNLPRRKTTSGIGDNDRSPDKPGGHPSGHPAKSDPLALLAKHFNCSKRNALLKWCQNKTATYAGIDITNFSSSWNDGLAFCALLHTFLPDMIPYKDLNSQDKVKNFTFAFKAADCVGIANTLNLTEILATERPNWQSIMAYVTNIYRHFEVDNCS